MQSIKGHASAIFHKVGQGLFYSFGIYLREPKKTSLTLIYDCGSFNKEALKREIQTLYFSNNSKTIDVAVISHFHQDHINGFRYLFENGFRIKNLFVPFYHPIELFLIAYLEYTGALGKSGIDIFDFYLNIYRYLADNVDNLYVIKPSENVEEKPEDENIREDGLNINLENLDESYLWIPTEAKIVTDKGNILYANNKQNIWNFKLFTCKDDEDEKFINDFREKVEEVAKKLKDRGFKITENGLIFSNGSSKNRKKFIEELKKKVRTIIKGSFYHNKNLALLHYPSVLGKGYIYNIPPYYLCFEVTVNCLPWLKENYWGWALTGDIELDEKCLKKFNSHFSNYFKHINFFQIPHHGSKHNWKTEFLSFFKRAKYFIASFGVHNKFNHPHMEVIEALTVLEKCFFPVNEQQLFCSKFVF